MQTSYTNRRNAEIDAEEILELCQVVCYSLNQSSLPPFSDSLSPASSFLKQAFEGEYPKLLRLYNELWRRLQQYSTSLQGALANVGGMDASVDIASAEMDSQDLFTHGKENYK